MLFNCRRRVRVILVGIAASFTFPAFGDDAGSKTTQGERFVCPAISTGDTAGAIDCEVNNALSTRFQTSMSSETTSSIPPE